MAIPGVWGDESGRLHLEWVGSEGIPSRGGLPWIVSLSGRSSIPPQIQENYQAQHPEEPRDIW